MASKPAVVWLHGAWHQPSHYSAFVEKLRGRGYEVNMPATASAAGTAVSKVFEADVAIAKEAIHSLTAAGKNVVVAMHSYGGVYGSDAVAELYEEFKGGAGRGRVVHLLYIAAIIIERGTSMMEEGLTPMALDVEDGLLHHLEPYNKFYATTATGMARKAIGQLMPQAAESFTTKTKYRGWADYDIPVTYVACDQDQALMLDTDVARIIKRFEAAALKNFTQHRIDCDHSPWMSAETQLMQIVSSVLGKASPSSKD